MPKSPLFRDPIYDGARSCSYLEQGSGRMVDCISESSGCFFECKGAE